jgi:hypothetical protein
VNIALWILLLANLVFALGVLIWVTRLRRSLKAVELRQEGLAAAPPLPPDVMRSASESGPLIAITILNPVELAVNKHWAAGALSQLTPGLLRRLVGSEASRILAEELPKYGVVAEVRLVDAA